MTLDGFTPPNSEILGEEEESGHPGLPKPPSIPVNHTTGAAGLLNVPAIRALCQGAMDNLGVRGGKYSMLQEERRGLLRLFGKGEGYERSPGYDEDLLADHGADSTPGDSHSDMSPPASEEWGQLGGLTPPGHQPELTRGGIDSNGMPDFSRETVNDLVKSYMEHINILHPILIKSHLDLLVEHFLKSIPESQTRQAGHKSKRKRAPTAGKYAEPHAILNHKPGHPFRSIGSAIVLLVMALGKICQHKGRIPDVWQSNHDLGDFSTGMGVASSLDREGSQPQSRRIPIGGAYPAKRPRNTDVIPGLAYQALATDIIGNQLAENSLQHVYANILAGLYYGEIKEKGLVVPEKDNPLVIAFWTCLQLESDIVTELPYPHSGILTYEENMPNPNVQTVQDSYSINSNVIHSYMRQLLLRNMLLIHFKEATAPFNSAKNTKKHFPAIDSLVAKLQAINHVTAEMGCDATEKKPATDTLGAQLRAKYYKTKVITYRHFILTVLKQGSTDVDAKVLNYIECGIRALISSTRAFYGLGNPGKDRLIVTNIWGTAYAQWGNVVTL
ncbi:hypothetical protein DL98DRAFT_554553 [Cadophora sp. DSE1049]|nr:hypothetical protein DL98DRAFT_554553 [Cadophora sp. DSE1049]